MERPTLSERIAHETDKIREAQVIAHPEDDPDGLYWKYRIFKEPEQESEDGHPVELISGPTYSTPPQDNISKWLELEEVKEFVFVLKPSSDRHARVAIAAYAWSCMEDKPELGEDLLDILTDGA